MSARKSWLWLTSSWFLAVQAITTPRPVPEGYHDYEALKKFMHDTHRKYPDITNLYNIGQSVEGRKLWVLELSQHPGNRSIVGTPNVKFIGNIHGNEPIGKEVLIKMISDLIQDYTIGDSEVVGLLERTRIHILPCLNPDGFEKMEVFICRPDNKGRNNSNNFDLNGNYPGVFQPNTQEEQPETKAVKRWLSDTGFILSANLQSGFEPFVYYPYDSVPDPENHQYGDERGESKTDDDELFKKLAKTYADANPDMGSKANYGGYINGAAMTPYAGSMMDYNYKYHGCMEINVELDKCKVRLHEEIEHIWKNNKKSVLNFIKVGLQRGLKGVVRDRETGRPIPGANVTLCPGTVPFRTTKRGEYWKLIPKLGYFTLEVEAENYTKKYEQVSITQEGLNIVDIQLSRTGSTTTVRWKKKKTTTTTTTPTTTRETAGSQLEEARSEPVVSSGSRITPFLLLLLFRFILLPAA